MNLMVNNYCNLHCPYCFAQEEMHSKKAMNITIENYKIFLDFLKKNDMDSVRLIGGEPTLHPDLDKLIQEAIDYQCFSNIVIFTNLTFSHEIARMLVEKNKDIDILLLPNINDLDMLLPNQKEKIIANLDYLSQNLSHFDRISINLYIPDQDLKKWEEIICRYNLKSIRWTIVAPNHEIKKDFDFYNYFHQFQPLLLQMAEWRIKYGIEIDSDCANFPVCCLDGSAISYIYRTQNDMLNKTPYCLNIVGDVSPDLTVRECFVSTGKDRKKLTDFDNYDQLDTYYHMQREERYKGKMARKQCIDCPIYKIYGHSCCCYGYQVLEEREGSHDGK